MEKEVTVRCRKSDQALVEAAIEPAIEDYYLILRKEVKAFKNKEPPVTKIIIDANRYLPEYDSKEGAESCMGGVVLHTRKGRIVCSNTIDERLSLTY